MLCNAFNFIHINILTFTLNYVFFQNLKYGALHIVYTTFVYERTHPYGQPKCSIQCRVSMKFILSITFSNLSI
jgi:hypothetical protein